MLLATVRVSDSIPRPPKGVFVFLFFKPLTRPTPQIRIKKRVARLTRFFEDGAHCLLAFVGMLLLLLLELGKRLRFCCH